MADTSALLAAILADRRDDTLRLAYADAIDATDPEQR
ncbi:MAG: TIGR02996 domain-containing protein [Bacteroidetes bacterium]|nr:TIGR02996 domain-containing protein [Bacteroidota bacterium]